MVGLAGGRALALNPAGSETVTRGTAHQRFSPFGEHQTGIDTPRPVAARLVAFRLLPDTDVDALGRLMRVWGTSITALMEGRPTLADATPDMAREATSLTVTVGWGPGVFALDGLARHTPAGFQDIPPMDHDRMDERWMGGDLVLVVSADDETTLTYASRRLTVDARPFATPAWVQDGSWRGTDAEGNAVTGRNLFGQVDGTGNPQGEDLARAVWSDDGWFTGGTQMVVRRIEMDLDEWDRLTRDRQEASIGRDLAHGAPLTGGDEHTAMDFESTDETGGLVIAEDAHSRLGHPSHNSGRTMLRRGWNYTHTDDTGNTTYGLVFVAYQRSIAETFIPVQRTMDLHDALNEWTTAIGSAVFAVLPGWAEGSYPGGVLLESL